MRFSMFGKVTAYFVSLLTLLCNWLNIPMKPMGQRLDLNGYELVFSDEFDGGAPDTEKWRPVAYAENGGSYAEDMVSVRDGAMVLTAAYRENGPSGAGWYSADLYAQPKFTHGYFEIRCICSEGGGFWSAFWLQSDHSYEHDISKGGVGGAEIDIMEAGLYTKATASLRNAVTSAVHCNGGDDDPENIDSKRLGRFRGNDIYRTYNTYGLEWTQEEYIFYVNGVETVRTDFAKGVSQVPEYLRISLCLPEKVTLKEGETVRMLVDYVKVYQKP